MKKYTFFLGLKDKDTKDYSKWWDDCLFLCKGLVETFVCEQLWGGTVSEARGVFMHEDGTEITEDSLRIETLGFSDDVQKYINFAKFLKEKFNQESVLMEVSEVEASFI